MVTTIIALALHLSATSSAGAAAPAPTWEKVYETTAPKDWVTSVVAFGLNDWIASSVRGVARATKDGIERTSTGSRAVLGLFVAAPDSIFAFGNDELVMHYDGKKWGEEHVGPKPKRPGRGADLLYSGFYVGDQIAAFGVTLILVRQPDHSWTEPRETERKKLLHLGQLGPSFTPPSGCDTATWRWLGKDRGFFRCHDRRAFIFDGGKLTPKGRIPTACESGFNGLTFGQGELFASCGPGKVWKTEGDAWKLFATFKGAKVGALSVTESCVFVAGTRAVWRSCRPSPPCDSVVAARS